VLEQSPLAPMGAATFEALRDLHPQEAAPPAAADPGLAYQVSAAGLQHVLCTLPRGSAAGLSGWTYEHIRTAATASAHGFQAVLQILNVLLAGTLPSIAELLDASLISIQKPGGGVRPIAIAEVWHRLAGLCAMKGCAAGMELQPLPMVVGVPGGSGCIGHPLHACMLADAECLTIQVDF
jgi:hypothetical protein